MSATQTGIHESPGRTEPRLYLAYFGGGCARRIAVRLGLGCHRRRKTIFPKIFSTDQRGADRLGKSCALIGCLVGALVAGALSDKFGRKRLLILSAFVCRTSLGNALAGIFPFSFSGGCSAAWPSAGVEFVADVYREVAPAQMRGKLVSINQLTIVVGILLAQVINWSLVRHLPAGATDEFIRNSWFGQQGWRWMFGLTALPSLLFFVGMFAVPEARAGSQKTASRSRQKKSSRKSVVRITARRRCRKSIPRWASEEIQHVRFADLLDPKMAKVLCWV